MLRITKEATICGEKMICTFIKTYTMKEAVIRGEWIHYTNEDNGNIVWERRKEWAGKDAGLWCCLLHGRGDLVFADNDGMV